MTSSVKQKELYSLNIPNDLWDVSQVPIAILYAWDILVNKTDEDLCPAETDCENSLMSQLYVMEINKCHEKKRTKA